MGTLDRRTLLARVGAMATPAFLAQPAGPGASGGRNTIPSIGQDLPATPIEGSSAAGANPDGGRERDRPNVIVLISDDMRSSDWVAMPETARILSRGAVYPNFILNTPICGPSRATLFTGKLPRNHGVLENDEEGTNAWTLLRDNIGRRDTIYNAAKRAGYRTCLAGKFMNGAPAKGRIATGFDRWFSTSELDYYDFALNENGRERTYKGDAYSTDVLADHAVSFIENTAVSRPFLLFFTPKAPKGPATPNSRFDEVFRDAKAERSPAWNEADVSDKPQSVRRRDPFTPEEIAELDRKEGQRLETLLSVDAAFRRIWDAVRSTGREETTIVMVMTDNGYAVGEHLLNGKGRPYDQMVRFTMMARGPGFDGRGEDRRMASMADIAPTLAQAMGTEMEDVDGVSLLEEWAREYVPIETSGGKEGYWALRGEHELYVEYDNGEREFYDYLTDPWELDNLLADWDGLVPALDPSTAKNLSARLAAFRACAGATCHGISG